jgi:DNA-binding LacI/PurR family transcriptional regulator
MKRDAITKALRAKISSGDYPPGSRIPIREELLEIYDASKGTLQTAINTLVEEGFLEACGSKGMIVAERPPHLFRMGMTIPGGDSGSIDSIWPLFERTINELKKEGSPFDFDIYRGIGKESDEESWTRLLEDMENRRLAGLFFNNPKNVSRKSFHALCESGVPIAAFAKADEFPGEEFLRFKYDWSLLLRSALKRVKAAGRRRAALLANTEFNREQMEFFKRELASSELESRPEDFQAATLSPQAIAWASNITRSVFRGPASERPDALVVLNENLLPFALEALLSLSLKPGVDVEVVSHCNFPASTPPPSGTSRIGFDARATLRAVFKRLDLANRGKKADGGNAIEPIWENDYERQR